MVLIFLIYCIKISAIYMSEHEYHEKCQQNSWRPFRAQNSEIDLLECIEKWRKLRPEGWISENGEKNSHERLFPATLSKEEFNTIKSKNIWKNIRETGIKEGRSLKQDIEIWRDGNPNSYVDDNGGWHIVTLLFPPEIDDKEKIDIYYGLKK